MCKGFDNKNYRTFVIFHKECNTVVTSGIVVEHQFKSRIPNKNKIITWEPPLVF